MSDEADIANDRAQLDLERAIAAARRSPERPEPTDICLNGCGDPPAPGSRWCCSECRDDWEHRQRMNKIRGAGL